MGQMALGILRKQETKVKEENNFFKKRFQHTDPLGQEEMWKMAFLLVRFLVK